MSKAVKAAGGVVLRAGEGGVAEAAIIHRPRYDDWTLPKGKLFPGEPFDVAALREVEEETGLRCRLEQSLGSVSYRDRKGRPKVIRYWLMRPVDGRFAPTREVDELRWLQVDEALGRLSYPHDRELLRLAFARSGER